MRYPSINFLTGVFVACAFLIASPARSHEFTMESVMSGFVKIEPGELHLVIRLPLHLLHSVKLPLTGREVDLPNAGPAIQRTLAALGREIAIREDGHLLVPTRSIGRLSLPSDRSFERYEDALGHIVQPIVPGTSIYTDQGYFDAQLTYPINSANSAFTIRTNVAPELKESLKFTIRYMPLAEESRAMVITSRSGTVSLNPTRLQAAGGFVALGIAHILSGPDHLLFLLCLVIPALGWRQVVWIVTGFTVAHSFTLLGSAYGIVPSGAWFPPFVETMIAASIVYMALENIAGGDLGRRWLVTGLFGLIHGFGFSFGLQEHLQFAGPHLLVSLFSFNVGVEIGQLLFLAVMLPVLAMFRRYVIPGRLGVIILSAIVVHTGWHWMIERADVLWKVEWPAWDAAGLAVAARWLAGVLLVIGGIDFIARRLRAGHRTVLPSLQQRVDR